MNNKKKILTGIVVILAILGALASIYFPNSKINEVIDETQNIIMQEIVVSEETKAEVADTKDAVNNGGDVSTTEIAKATVAEEKEVTDEGAEDNLEVDALVEQENIAYNGDNAGKGLDLLGKWTGLTYYSQADSRWANKLYTSIGNKTQTMKSSACGPTSAAIVVSSAKGAILPTVIANLSVDNGYRTANSGTAWAFYPFVADYFGFKEYYTTSNFETAMNYLKQKNSIGTSKYYIICSCGSGLFTSGGHYIVLASLDNNTIQVMDPYLYSGKFNTTSRKVAKVEVNGISVYVSKANFKKYANYKNFWIFSNDKGNEQKKKESSREIKNTTETYIRYVRVSSHLNVRRKPGTNYKIVDTLKNGTKVIVYETISGWSRIGTNKWVSSTYLTTTKPVTIKNTVGKKKVLKQNCYLHKKSNLKGTTYYYFKNTRVKVLKNVSSTVDYIQVIATGRKAYIKISNYK